MAVTAGPKATVPAAKIGSPGSIIIASTDAFNPQPNVNYYSVLPAGSLNNGNAGSVGNCGDVYGGWCRPWPPAGIPVWGDTNSYALRPQDLSALDSKMDDGNGFTGNVRSGLMHDKDWAPETGNDSSGHNTTGYCNNASTGAYLTDTNYECLPMIRILSQTGDPD